MCSSNHAMFVRVVEIWAILNNQNIVVTLDKASGPQEPHLMVVYPSLTFGIYPYIKDVNL